MSSSLVLLFTVDQTKAPNILELLKSHQSAMTSNRLLSVEYVFLQEYLYLLRAASEAVHFAGPKAMFYLAAAVSDFYIPTHEMVRRKKGLNSLRNKFSPGLIFFPTNVHQVISIIWIENLI